MPGLLHSLSFIACGLGAAALFLLTQPGAGASTGDQEDQTDPAYVLGFTMERIDGEPHMLSEYEGRVVMIVNVASRCGMTPQYEALQKLYEKHAERGLVVLGFPANNFMGQEPGTNEEIKNFCSTKYNVTFPMFGKISVKGEDIDPLYKFLTDDATNPEFAGEITWNFNKFLVSRDGKVVARFGSKVKPDAPEVTEAIEMALQKNER